MSLHKAQNFWVGLTSRLNSVGQWIPPLFIRLILFWEFYESGLRKINGSNWFSSIQQNFPFPFNHVSADVSWFMATWAEFLFAFLLLFGLFTRFAAVSLLIVTPVATAAVHWPDSYGSLAELWKGYGISSSADGNFKLPLLYIILLMPLIFSGAGKFSLDHLFTRLTGSDTSHPIQSDFISKGLMLVVIGLPLFFVIPTLGISLITVGLVLMVADRFITPTG